MNSSDPSAERIIAERAPTLRAWLERLHRQAASKLEDGDDPAPVHIDALALERPFRAVAKTFQVKGWRSLKARYLSLEPADRAALPLDVRNAFDDAVASR